MAGSFTDVAQVPRKPHFWRLTAISCVLLALGACGVVDYDFHRQNIFASSSKNKDIGVVHFHFADGAEPYDVRFRRVKGGYAVQAPLYEEVDGSHMRFIVSRTKEYKGFVGVEGRYNF